MSVFLYNFFHNETNDRTEKGEIKIPKNSDNWPESWKNIEYKIYSLFKPIPLNKIEKTFLKKLLDKRRSGDRYIIGNKVNLHDLGYILGCGYGLQDDTKELQREDHRTVPSGGKRYPLETYVFLFKSIDECHPGVYHYGIKNHQLEPVVVESFSKNDIVSIIPQKSLHNAIGMICITSIFDRSVRKYGSMAYRLILLEAGHVGQNLLLAGTERGINISPIAGTDVVAIESRIGLSKAERVVYTLFF